VRDGINHVLPNDNSAQPGKPCHISAREKLLRNRHHNDIDPLRGWIGMTETQPDMTPANRKQSGSGTQTVHRVWRFFAANMETATCRQMTWLALAVSGAWIVGCRHMPLEDGQGMSAQFGGDPATNVMIVPAWAAPGTTAGTRPPTNAPAEAAAAPKTFPFPDYDQRVAKHVHDRWLMLLKSQTSVPYAGRVEVEFSLTPEGYVFGWRTASEDLPPSIQDLCKRAIVEVAPFPKWTEEMKRKIGSNARLVHFTFHLSGEPQAR